MTAALTLLPWTNVVLSRTRLKAWMLAAERLDAGIFPVNDYPPPRMVALLCEIVHDVLTHTAALVKDRDSRVVDACDDAAEIIAWITGLDDDLRDLARKLDTEEKTSIQLEEELDGVKEARDEARKERDSLEKQRDRAEAMCAARDATLARIAALASGKEESDGSR